MRNEGIKQTSRPQVFTCPSMSPMISGRRLCFVFSIFQVEDILSQAAVQPVPFAPEFLSGVAQWRDQVLPVISLEGCLGLSLVPQGSSQRLMVIRTAAGTNRPGAGLKGMLKVDAATQMTSLPEGATPIAPEGWIQNRKLVRGVYAHEDKLLVVAHMENILNGLPKR